MKDVINDGICKILHNFFYFFIDIAVGNAGLANCFIAFIAAI